MFFVIRRAKSQAIRLERDWKPAHIISQVVSIPGVFSKIEVLRNARG